MVLTLIVAAATTLAFLILKAGDMLGSSEAYWGFLVSGIMVLLGLNSIIINLVKLLQFKKIETQLLSRPKKNI